MRRFVLCCLVLLCACPAMAVQDCYSNPNDCHVGKAIREINLGPMPMDAYDGVQTNSSEILPFATCPSTSIIRDCIISHLTTFKNQGATGVRFQFGLGGGAYSTAFNANGTLNATWVANLERFFQDLYVLNLRNVIPTPALGLWGLDQPEFFDRREGQTTCGVEGKTIYYMRWLPYGLVDTPGVGYPPDCVGHNNGYDVAPPNTYFWGWDPFLALVDKILERAAFKRGFYLEDHLMVTEFDIQNEVTL